MLFWFTFSLAHLGTERAEDDGRALVAAAVETASRPEFAVGT